MSRLEYELIVAKTILEHSAGAYLSMIALDRLAVALDRIAEEHQIAARTQ